MALDLRPLTQDIIDSCDIFPLGTKGEIAAFIAAYLTSGEAISDVVYGVTSAQVSAMKKALENLAASSTHVIDVVSTVTGQRTFTVTRPKKDGTVISYDVTRDVRQRHGVFVRTNDTVVS